MASKTILEVIEATKTHLARHGVENPRLNAELLLGHVLGVKRLDLYMTADRPLAEAELAPLRDLVRRRARREPLQHLLGAVEFFGRAFAVDARALIPRAETEQLVEFILAAHPPEGASILDVGAGSGVIALTLAAEIPGSRVTAIDLSPGALELARENARKLGQAHPELGIEERVVFLQGDLLEGVAGTFDLIAANLPYIPTGVLPTLAEEVRRDPALALDGGPDGLALLLKLAAAAPARLKPGGLLALEIGHDQADRLLAALGAAGFQDIRCREDYLGVRRFLFATRGEDLKISVPHG